ncbi:type II toxin-antitoxin system Phd/YefM family antitoxin [Celeribacter sp.]|uniref:type II toxin-antitoxin system Phd/YefM family antitoxin n=1 Tax=Celeribacter sp. TaxID=1890673 RepID=UPI003A954106
MLPFSMNLTDLRSRLTEVLDRVQTGDHAIVRRYGRAVAAIVPMEDLERIWEHIDDEKLGPRQASGRRPGRSIGPWDRILAKADAEREAARREGRDKKWVAFWVWVRSLQSSD